MGDAADFLRRRVADVERPAGDSLRHRQPQVLHLRPGVLAAGHHLPLGPADRRGAFAVPFHRGRGAPVVRLRLSADGVHGDLPLVRARHRGRPQPAHPARSRRLERAKARPQGGQAWGLDRDRAVDRFHVRRLRHSHPRTVGRGAVVLDRTVGDVLDPVLRLRDLRQRRLDARAGLHLHVSLRALPERDVRQGHADHHL